jgi:hypothetical protein
MATSYDCIILGILHGPTEVPTAKALTEEERTTCPDGHGGGGGVLPDGALQHGQPRQHLQQRSAPSFYMVRLYFTQP